MQNEVCTTTDGPASGFVSSPMHIRIANAEPPDSPAKKTRSKKKLHMWSLCDRDLLLVNLDMFPFNLMHVWEFGPLYFDQQVDVIEPYLCLWTWFVCAEKTTSWYFEPYLCLWTTLCLCRFQKNGQQPCWNFQRNLEYHVILLSYVLFLSISVWPSKNLGVAVCLICLCLLVPDSFF